MRIGIFIIAMGVGMTACAQAAEPSSVDEAVGRLLVQMFNTGYVRGPNSLPQAQRSYQAARELSKSDPRVDYGFGLVLLKQLRNKEALAHFQAITKRPGPEYWPAWQAVIWMHFVAADYTAGYERLKEFAERVSRLDASNTGEDDDGEEQEQLAEWLGQVLEALQISAETPKQRETIQQTEQELTELLGPDLETSLARGRASIQLLHSLAQSDIQETQATAKAKQQAEITAVKEQIASDREQSAETRENLKKSAEGLKRDFEKLQANFDKQLSRLERDYDFQQKRALSISASQIQTATEIQLLEQQPIPSGRLPSRNISTAAANEAVQLRKSALETQLIKYQFEFEQAAAMAVAISQKAAALLNQRSAAVLQYEKASGQLIQRDAALDKWQDRLKKDEDSLKTAIKNKPKAVLNKVQRSRTFRTYIDLDLAAERLRVLEAYSVTEPKIVK